MDLVREHREIGEILSMITEDIKDGEFDIGLFEKFSDTLKNHIYLEEEVIFPTINENGEYKDVIVGLMVEHGSFWLLINKINKAITEERSWEIPKIITEISLIMKSHDNREETVLGEKIKSINVEPSTERPKGWKCRRYNERTK